MGHHMYLYVYIYIYIICHYLEASATAHQTNPLRFVYVSWNTMGQYQTVYLGMIKYLNACMSRLYTEPGGT